MEQHVKSSLQPIIDFFQKGWRLSGVVVRLATANMFDAWQDRYPRTVAALLNGDGFGSRMLETIIDALPQIADAA